MSFFFSFFPPLADKHKMERFLRPDAPTVVSVYAPITFSPAGVLLFKQRNDGEAEKFCLLLKSCRFLAASPRFYS